MMSSIRIVFKFFEGQIQGIGGSVIHGLLKVPFGDAVLLI